MTVPILIDHVARHNDGHRILAGLEGRDVVYQRRLSESDRKTVRWWLFSLVALFAFSGYLLIYAGFFSAEEQVVKVKRNASEDIFVVKSQQHRPAEAPVLDPGVPTEIESTDAIQVTTNSSAILIDAEPFRFLMESTGTPENPLVILEREARVAGVKKTEESPNTVLPSKAVNSMASLNSRPSHVLKNKTVAPKISEAELQNDAAVLASVMNLGLPESNFAGSQVYQVDSVRVRELPQDQVVAKLQECEELGFFQRPECKQQVCAAVEAAHTACMPTKEEQQVMP